MKLYKKKAMLFEEGPVRRESHVIKCKTEPEHDQNIGYMVHPIIIDKPQLFVSGRHEK